MRYSCISSAKFTYYPSSEAAVRSCSSKTMYWKISHNLQVNPCVRASFQTPPQVFYIKFCRMFQSFMEHLRAIASVKFMNYDTAKIVSKYGVFSGLYFPAFGLNTERYGVFFHAVMYYKVFYCNAFAGAKNCWR